jgi:hypothetical protein
MVEAQRASFLLAVATLSLVFAAANAQQEQDQEQPKRVPPRLGERIMDPPVRNEYESAAAHLFGTTLSPSAMVNACARLCPEFSKENSAALEAWNRRHAEVLALIRRSAREVLLKHSQGVAARVETTLQKHTMDAQGGAQEQLARETPAVARKTCQTIPLALTRGPFALDANPEVAILRTHGEDSTN